MANIPINDRGKIFYKKIKPQLGAMYDRWRVHRFHDDWADYRTTAAQWCRDTHSIKFINLTHSPFVFTFQTNGFSYAVRVSICSISLTKFNPTGKSCDGD